MPLNFGSVSNVIEASGKETQTIDGNLVLNAVNGYVSMGFENDENSASVGITADGDLELSSENGNVIVGTPDGSDENAVVNVEYVNNVVGTIEDVLETV
jgi:hypothetical protein